MLRLRNAVYVRACALLAAVALSSFAAAAAAQPPPVPEVRFTVTGFDVVGDNPLPEGETQALLAGYTGEYAGLDGLLAAADALEQALAAAGHGFHRVALPPQTLDGGRVTLRVVRFRLGSVRVEGNRFFPSEQVRAALPTLVPGEAPATREIARTVAAANRHPSRKLSVSMRQGEQPDTVDAVVEVKDQRPWALFGLFNNMGSPDTKRGRMTLGAQYSDLFDKGHVITASWTTAPTNMGDVRQGGISYQVPIPELAAWASLSWVKSDVDSGVVQQVFDVSGSGKFWIATFRQELHRIGALRHAWSLGLQDRDFDNDVILNAGGPAVSLGTQVRSRPLSLRWDGEYARREGNFTGYVAFVHNLPGGSDSDDGAYNAARAGAKSSWNALRFGATAAQLLPERWEARARVDGQYSNVTLIPGEQIGFGGAYSIRGFEERTTSGDSGLVGSVELWTPPIATFEGLRLLGFMDVGFKDLENPAAGEEANDTLLSMGFGARWQWRQNIRVSLDWGSVIKQADGAVADPGNSRWHVSVLMRY